MQICKRLLILELRIEPADDATEFGGISAHKPLAKVQPGDRVYIEQLNVVVKDVKELDAVPDAQNWMQPMSQSR